MKAERFFFLEPFNPKITAAVMNFYIRHAYIDDSANARPFLEYIEKKPDKAPGYYALASSLMSFGHVKTAETYYAKAEESGLVFNADSYFNRGKNAFYAGNYRQCVESLSKSVVSQLKEGDHRMTYLYLSWCYGLQGDSAAAKTNLQKAISLGGSQIADMFEVRSEAYLSNNFKCESNAEKMIGNYFKKDYKSLEKQYAAFFRLYSCFPDNDTVLNQGVSLAGKIQYFNDWSSVYYAKRDKFDPLAPLSDEGLQKDINFYIPYAKNFYLKKEYDKVLDHTYKLLVRRPNAEIGYYFHALALLEKPEYKILAWRHANKILQLNPRSDAARMIRARVYYELKNNKENALAEIAQGIKDNPQSKYAGGYFQRGKIYYETGEYAKAVSDFDKVLSLEPKFLDADFYRNLALNPKASDASAIAAKERENVQRQKLNEIIKNANSAMNHFRFMTSRTNYQTEKCKYLKDLISSLSGAKINLGLLKDSIASGSPLIAEIEKNINSTEQNIKNAESGGAACK
jgi:tetratricopeptide (TPR) repeat protein